MKKLVTAAAIIGIISLAGFQIASAHGGRYFSNDTYGPGYCGTYYNGSRINAVQDQDSNEKFRENTGFKGRYAYGHGPGMMRGYGWGWGSGGHMMNW
jgi:hypothetical protein